MCVKFQLPVSEYSRDIKAIVLPVVRYAYKRGHGIFDLDSAVRSLLAGSTPYCTFGKVGALHPLHAPSGKVFTSENSI